MALFKFMLLKGIILLSTFVYLRNHGLTLIALPILHASLVDFLVAIASHPSVNLPLLLGKDSSGNFPPWSIIFFGPFLAFIRIYAFIKRIKTKEPSYTEVHDGLYVGGWPCSPDRMPPGEPAIVDCTCELPRISSLSKNAYVCIPIWDAGAPRPSEIESAVRWASRKITQKTPVLIHCAFGHGRSVSIMCALLVSSGIAEDWKEAEKIIKEHRPRIRMNALHRKSLEEWSKFRNLSKANEEMNVSSLIQSDGSKGL